MAAYVTDSSGQLMPMTRASRAASMTSAVIRSTPLLSFITRSACSSSRVTSRKLPAVVRLSGDGLSGSGVRDVRAQVGEGCGQDDGEFFSGQGSVVGDETDAAVELRIASQALFDRP
ncbi:MULTISPECIES: hypothetical protein [unclassified Nonomuraea]|uniref:hypothetical protein n=1 Tax=unclassified Nonomuraea TaxID=2593643 RepID=UPI00340DEA14